MQPHDVCMWECFQTLQRVVWLVLDIDDREQHPHRKAVGTPDQGFPQLNLPLLVLPELPELPGLVGTFGTFGGALGGG